jgi:hypothetical protein
VAGVEVSTLHKLKVVLKRCRDRGDQTCLVQFLTPVAGAVHNAEREYLCDDELLERARRRIAEGNHIHGRCCTRVLKYLLRCSC